jgi:hypothetical protein
LNDVRLVFLIENQSIIDQQGIPHGCKTGGERRFPSARLCDKGHGFASNVYHACVKRKLAAPTRKERGHLIPEQAFDSVCRRPRNGVAGDNASLSVNHVVCNARESQEIGVGKTVQEEEGHSIRTDPLMERLAGDDRLRAGFFGAHSLYGEGIGVVRVA